MTAVTDAAATAADASAAVAAAAELAVVDEARRGSASNGSTSSRNDRRPSSLRCLSLFSGCGGLDLGLARAGFSIVLANDLDSLAAASHRASFPDVPFLHGSVTELTRQRAAALTEGRSDQELALLAGGPPCPPFSKSRFYRTDKPRALDDPVGMETITGYLDALRAFRPRAFLLENVAGLAYRVHGQALQTILAAAQDAGYVCDHRVLNAADYGVPQIRQRLFVVGIRRDLVPRGTGPQAPAQPLGRFTWPEPTHADPDKRSLLTQDTPAWTTAGQAIGDLDTEQAADDAGHFAGGRHHDLLRQVPPGDNYLYFTAERGHPDPKFKWRSRYWSFLLKLSPDKPAWTIQARRSNNMGPFHWRNRILRIAEIKRLQTFPDDWHLEGTVEQQWRQVGNAVPPLLAQRLGEALLRAVGAPASTATASR